MNECDLLNVAKQFQTFDNHSLIRLFLFRGTIAGFVVIHRIFGKLPSFGATRVLRYRTNKEALNDVLSLSKIMTTKSAILGLPYGGAKAVLFDSPTFRTQKGEVLKIYAEFLNSLNGTFITGADMGLPREDVVYLNRFTPYVVGIRVDPARYTAVGLAEAMKTCSMFLSGSEKLSSRSFAIQGLGKVGAVLLGLLYETDASIAVSEKDERTLSEMKAKYQKISVAQGTKIYRIPVDFFCPCAEGGIITEDTARILNCKAIVGGANNQIKSNGALNILDQRRIVYCPDFLVNSGGFISVVTEYEMKERTNQSEVLKRIKKISRILSKILTTNIQ